MVGAAVGAVILSVYVWPHRNRVAAKGLIGLLAVVGLWSILYALEIAAWDEAYRNLWGNLKYLGVNLLPIAYVAFVWEYTGRGRRISGKVLTYLAIEPAVVLVLLAIPATHDWIRYYIPSDPPDPYPVVGAGGLFWVHIVYTYGLLAWATLLLMSSLVKVSRYHRTAVTALLAAVSLPWVANILYNFVSAPFDRFDATPVAFVVTGGVLVWGVFRFGLFGLSPLARDAIVESMNDAAIVIDAQDRVIDVNGAAREIFGHPEPDIVGTQLSRFVPLHEDRDLVTLGSSGRERTFEVLHSPLQDREGGEVGRLVTLRDVTDRLQTEEALQKAEAQYRTLVDGLPAVVYTAGFGRGAPWQFVSRQIEQMLGYSVEEWNRDRLWYSKIHPEDRQRVLDEEHFDLTRTDTDTTASEYRLIAKNGRVVWVRDESTVVRDENGKPLHYQGVIFDISERKAFEEQLEHSAFHDPLTDLANRVLFKDRVAHALDRLDRHDRGIAVVFIDLDDFKTINDSLGHAAGDTVLKEVARRLNSSLRPVDTAARFGGDEFGVLVEDIVVRDSVKEVALRIQDALRAPMIVAGRDLVVRASLGIAFADPGHSGPKDADELIRNADMAMYTAKREGQDRLRVFEPEMHEVALNRLELRVDLEKAPERSELELHYQPVVELDTGRIAGIEALLRWKSRRHGMVTPDRFIPLAEESGLIGPIGKWVIDEVCEQAKQLQSHASEVPKLHINISAAQLHSSDLYRHVAHALERCGVPAERLVLEITESVLVRNLELSKLALDKLKKLGVEIALDDFGLGYSSLVYLSRFPVDMLKIDRSFVALLDDDEDSALTNALLSFGEAMGLVTIAEGIETTAQLDRLREMGCRQGQGHRFSPPLEKEETISLLKEPLALTTRWPRPVLKLGKHT